MLRVIFQLFIFSYHSLVYFHFNIWFIVTDCFTANHRTRTFETIFYLRIITLKCKIFNCVLIDFLLLQDSDGEKSDDNLVVDVSNEVSMC